MANQLLNKEHKKKFGVEPIIIGAFWDDPAYIENEIKKAINSNKPYNELEMIEPEEKRLYKSGDLDF